MAKPKTKKTKVQASADDIAVQLGDVRTRMAKDKVLNDALTKAFKEALAVEGRNEAGNYHLSKATTFKVAVEELALPFALQRGLVKIDTGKVHDVFRLDEGLRFQDPEQFGFEETTVTRVVPRGQDEE